MLASVACRRCTKKYALSKRPRCIRRSYGTAVHGFKLGDLSPTITSILVHSNLVPFKVTDADIPPVDDLWRSLTETYNGFATDIRPKYINESIWSNAANMIKEKDYNALKELAQESMQADDAFDTPRLLKLVITTLCAASEKQLAMDVIDSAVAKGAVLNGHMFTPFGKLCKTEELVALMYKITKSKGFDKHDSTGMFSYLINKLHEAYQSSTIEDVFELALKLDVPLDINAYNALLNVSSKKSHNGTLKIYEEMTKHFVPPNGTTLTTLASSHAYVGQFQNAVDKLDSIRQLNLAMNETVLRKVSEISFRAGDAEGLAKSVKYYLKQYPYQHRSMLITLARLRIFVLKKDVSSLTKLLHYMQAVPQHAPQIDPALSFALFSLVIETKKHGLLRSLALLLDHPSTERIRLYHANLLYNNLVQFPIFTPPVDGVEVLERHNVQWDASFLGAYLNYSYVTKFSITTQAMLDLLKKHDLSLNDEQNVRHLSVYYAKMGAWSSWYYFHEAFLELKMLPRAGYIVSTLKSVLYKYPIKFDIPLDVFISRVSDSGDKPVLEVDWQYFGAVMERIKPVLLQLESKSKASVSKPT